MRGVAQMFGSALVMGVAVCGMHYVGMLAATFEPTEENPASAIAGGIGGAYLGATIFGVTTVLLATVLAISVVRQQRRAVEGEFVEGAGERPGAVAASGEIDAQRRGVPPDRVEVS